MYCKICCRICILHILVGFFVLLWAASSSDCLCTSRNLSTVFFFWLPPTEHSSAVYLWQENRFRREDTQHTYKSTLQKNSQDISVTNCALARPVQNLSDREISGKYKPVWESKFLGNKNQSEKVNFRNFQDVFWNISWTSMSGNWTDRY